MDDDGGIEVAWWLSRLGPEYGWEPWPDDLLTTLGRGEALWVRVAATNRGELAQLAAWNLVAPFGVELLQWDPHTRGYRAALAGVENREVGNAPDYSVQYHFQERMWPTNFTWVSTYLLVATSPVSAVRLLHEVTGGEPTTRLLPTLG